MKDAMYDAQEEFGVTKIEIYPNSTCSSTRRHKRRSNENRRSGPVEKDLERIGIIFREVEDAYFDDELDISLNKTIH